MFEKNLAGVEARIASACHRSGRGRSDVTLIAVSKTQPIEAIEALIALDIRDFGENKVQELTSKIEAINIPLHWHLIGHLQKNKVKYMIDKVHLIHSVDSYALAEKIQSEALKRNLDIDILIQVNIANEKTKFGIPADDTLELVTAIAKLQNVHIRGLMTVTPFEDDPEKNRIHFRNLRQLAVDITSKNIDNVTMTALSMGMTGDYVVAIEEGATLVRVGTGIFGERNYNI